MQLYHNYPSAGMASADQTDDYEALLRRYKQLVRLRQKIESTKFSSSTVNISNLQTRLITAYPSPRDLSIISQLNLSDEE